MSQDFHPWLAARAEGVPATLQALVAQALDGRSEASLHAGLRAAADALIERAINQSEAGDATELLAADALITYACEVQSELAPDRLHELT